MRHAAKPGIQSTNGNHNVLQFMWQSKWLISPVVNQIAFLNPEIRRTAAKPSGERREGLLTPRVMVNPRGLTDTSVF